MDLRNNIEESNFSGSGMTSPAYNDNNMNNNSSSEEEEDNMEMASSGMDTNLQSYAEGNLDSWTIGPEIADEVTTNGVPNPMPVTDLPEVTFELVDERTDVLNGLREHLHMAERIMEWNCKV